MNVYSPVFTNLKFFLSVIACLVALQTSATSKYRARRLVTVTACHACFIPCDVELHTGVTCREVGNVVSDVLATWLGGSRNTPDTNLEIPNEIDPTVRKVCDAKEAGEERLRSFSSQQTCDQCSFLPRQLCLVEFFLPDILLFWIIL